jgi:hypothetical protein
LPHLKKNRRQGLVDEDGRPFSDKYSRNVRLSVQNYVNCAFNPMENKTQKTSFASLYIIKKTQNQRLSQ